MLFLGIKETTREYRLKKWADIIAEQRKSGLSIKAFCTDRDLSQHAFFYWLRLLRTEISKEKPLVQAVAAPAFVPLSSAEPHIVAADKISLHYGAFQMLQKGLTTTIFCSPYTATSLSYIMKMECFP